MAFLIGLAYLMCIIDGSSIAQPTRNTHYQLTEDHNSCRNQYLQQSIMEQLVDLRENMQLMRAELNKIQTKGW